MFRFVCLVLGILPKQLGAFLPPSKNTEHCTFKARLDKFWHSQDIAYDFRAQLQGTGSRSEVLCEKFQ